MQRVKRGFHEMEVEWLIEQWLGDMITADGKPWSIEFDEKENEQTEQVFFWKPGVLSVPTYEAPPTALPNFIASIEPAGMVRLEELVTVDNGPVSSTEHRLVGHFENLHETAWHLVPGTPEEMAAWRGEESEQDAAVEGGGVR